MADDENIIEDLDTLLGQPINEQPIGVPQDQHDLYDSYIDAINSGDNARHSTIKKFIDAEEQGLAGSEAWNRAAADHQLPEGTPGETGIPSFFPGIVSSVTTDTAGIINRLLPSFGTTQGDPQLYGGIDYFTTTFGKAHEGEMVIPMDQVKSNPNFEEYIENMSAMMSQNASSQLDRLREDKGLITEDDWNSYLQELHAKDMAGDLSDEEREEVFYIQKLTTQVVDPRPYRLSEDKQSMIIHSDLLPSVKMEPDPKFTDEGYLSLPYGGVWSMRDGELFLEAPSMFRATDEIRPDQRGIFQSDEGTDYLKKMEDFLYPNLSPNWSYGDTGASTLGYQAGQLAPGIAGLTQLGVKGAKGLASLYRGAKNKLLQRQPIQAVDYLKTEPYFNNVK